MSAMIKSRPPARATAVALSLARSPVAGVPRVWATALATVLLMALALLQGCANAPDKPAEPVATDEPPRMAVGPNERADFDAAMKAIADSEDDKAIVLFNKLVPALPKNPIPHINLALLHRKQNKLAQAEDHLKAALEIAPGHPVANNEYALLYRKTGRFLEARKLYEGLLQRHPNFAIVHRNLGILCDLYLQDYACALTHYTRYGEEHGEDKQLKIWLADVQRRAAK